MRKIDLPLWIVFGMLLTSLPVAAAERFGVATDKQFPQTTPKETLSSAIKAIENKRLDYLLAQLTDPEWVDQRVAVYAGGFAELVRESTLKLDPGQIKRLNQFLKDGEFQTMENTTVVKLKASPDRVIRLRKSGDRWYLQNRFKP